MWEPTTIECRIAAAILKEYADHRGGRVPTPARRGDAWDVDRFIHNVFSLLAEALEDSDDPQAAPWDRLTYKQHCAFWHVVRDYKWETLGEYKEIIETVSGLLESAQEKYESRWMEWEGRYVRRELAKNLKELAAIREARLLSHLTDDEDQ